MDDLGRIDGEAGQGNYAAYFMRLRADVVGFYGIAACATVQVIAEIAEGTLILIKERTYKTAGGRKLPASGRALDRQRPFAIFEIGGFDQGRKVGAVIGMEVRKQDKIEVCHLRPGFAEAQSATAAAVDQHAGLAVLP